MSAPADLHSALSSLPHAHPFRFVTALTALQPGAHAQGLWRLTGDEPFFAGHFPGQPIVPGVLIIEALAQIGGIAAWATATGADQAPRPGRLAQVSVKVLGAAPPPIDIHLRATVSRAMGALVMLDVHAATPGGEALATGTLVLASAG